MKITHIAVTLAGLVTVAAALGLLTGVAGAAPDEAPAAPVVTSDAGPATPLVPYDGPQAGAFSIELIPQGWVVQGADAGSLTLAPADAADQDPASYDGKIVVLLESAAALAEPNAEIDGAPAVLEPDEQYHHYAHVYVTGGGGAVHLQVPPTSGGRWSDADLLALAGGITVADGAEPTVG